MILLRITSLSSHTAAFAERLATESGHRVCFVVDERRGEVDVGGFDKIGITRRTCWALGLYTPLDFGWRCGDYGFYFARRRYPDERFFWLIEYDVRLTGPSAAHFFDRFAGADRMDLIAGHYRRAESGWYWTHTMIARGQAVWRCLFPVVRLSATAIDLLHAERRSFARRPFRLANWPNDESFVATVVTRAGMACADLNDFGDPVYDPDTYNFDRPLDGDAIDDRAPPVRLLHPILFGDDLRRKVARMAWIAKGESLPRKVKRRCINIFNKWSRT